MTPVAAETHSRVSDIAVSYASPDANAAWLLCDRHPSDAIAFTVVSSDGAVTDLSFGDLRDRSCRFAAALRTHGVQQGDRVATLMGKSVDLVSVILGIWRIGAVYVPLFTAFASDAVQSRLSGAAAKVVVADAGELAKVPPGPWKLIVADADPGATGPGASLLARELEEADPLTSSVAVGGAGAVVQMFTSGTTGAPKGVVHSLDYVAGWQAYLELTLGVEPDSSYWCGADPGWAYGLYAAIVAPMALGLRSILQQGGFDAARTWTTLADLGVTDYAAAPTVYRSLRASGIEPPSGLALRRLSSAGEPLTKEVNDWARSTLGLEVHDHYGQTELGMVVGFPHHPSLSIPVKDENMGIPLPGWKLKVLKQGTSEPAETGELGQLAADVAGSRLMTFDGYVDGRGDGGRFTADRSYYLTGDLAAVMADGTLRFASRDDDVIIMAGYRIGPFDVESILAQHEAVAECAVVAGPDPVRGEVIEAFVVLRPGATGDDDLVATLQDLVRNKLAAHAYPRRVHIVAALPKTASGKIQRSELRRTLREKAKAEQHA